MSNDDNRNFFSDMWNKATSEQNLPYVMLGLIVLIVVFLGTVWVIRRYNRPPTPTMDKDEARTIGKVIYDWRLTITIVMFFIWLIIAAIFTEVFTLDGKNAAPLINQSSSWLSTIFAGPMRLYQWFCVKIHTASHLVATGSGTNLKVNYPTPDKGQ